MVQIVSYRERKNSVPKLGEMIGGTKTKTECQGSLCQRYVLAALLTVRLGLTDVGNQAKSLKYSKKKKVVFCTSLDEMFKSTHTTPIHRRRQSRDWREHSKMPGFCLIVAAASTIRAVKSSSGSTGDVYIGALMWLHRKKPIGVRTGDLGGQATGPPRPVQRSLKWRWDECSKEDLISLTIESAVTIKQQPGIFESTRRSLSAVYRGRWPYVRASALNCYAKQL